MLKLYKGKVEVEEFFKVAYNENRFSGFGAFNSFIGIVREENGISGLYFEIYKPLLDNWFNKWQEEAKKKEAKIYMAHTDGLAKVGESSFCAFVFSRHRDVSFDLLKDFVEDFKKNAPIWKYDYIGGKKVFAMDRAKEVDNSGILGG